MPLEDTIVKRSTNGIATWWPTNSRCANNTPLTNWLTDCLPPWSTARLPKQTSPRLVKNVPKVSYRVDTIPPLVCSVPDGPSPRCCSLRSLLILLCNLNLSLPSCIFRFRLQPACHVLHPYLPTWLDHTNVIWHEVQIMYLLVIHFSSSFPYIAPLRKENLYPCVP
jgi:hypothetical protein